MRQLTICTCPECGTEFAMAREALENIAEVTCPICEKTFEPPTGVGDEENDDDEADDDDDEADDEPDDDEGTRDEE